MEGKLLNDNLCFILERLAQNETIYKLIYPDAKPFSEDLIHKNILSIPRIPADRKGSFIIVNPVKLAADRDGNKTMLMRIDIMCGVDNSDWICDGQVRCFLIMEEVIKEMQNVCISGIGHLVLDTIDELESSNVDFGGYALGYFCSAIEES